jgi:hypothetical protein
MRLVLFNGFVVTANDDNTIPLHAKTIGVPTDDAFQVKVSTSWLIKTINDLIQKCDELEASLGEKEEATE